MYTTKLAAFVNSSILHSIDRMFSRIISSKTFILKKMFLFTVAYLNGVQLLMLLRHWFLMYFSHLLNTPKRKQQVKINLKKLSFHYSTSKKIFFSNISMNKYSIYTQSPSEKYIIGDLQKVIPREKMHIKSYRYTNVSTYYFYCVDLIIVLHCRQN